METGMGWESNSVAGMTSSGGVCSWWRLAAYLEHSFVVVELMVATVESVVGQFGQERIDGGAIHRGRGRETRPVDNVAVVHQEEVPPLRVCGSARMPPKREQVAKVSVE